MAANRRPPAYASVDFGQYTSWPTTVDPIDGKTYYSVPGVPGAYYDPTTGRVGAGTSLLPSLKVDAEKKANEQINPAPGVGEQLLPVVGSVGGTLGGAYAVKTMLGPSAAGSAGAAGAAGTAGAAAAPAATSGAGLVGQGAGLTTQMGSAAAPTMATGAQGAAGAAGAAGASASPYALSGIGSAGNVILPGLGLVGLGDVFINERTGARGAAQGAASGAMIGSYFGPVGIGVGAGLGLAAGLLNRYGDKDRWKEEGDRLRKLKEKGVFVPDELIASMPQGKGRSKGELIELERQREAAGQHSNVAFAESRNEADLRGADIVGYSTFAERDPDWFKRPLDQRIQYAQELLDAGIVSEGRGQIKVQWDKAPAPPWSRTDNAAAPTAQVTQPQPAAAPQAPAVNTQSVIRERPQVKPVEPPKGTTTIPRPNMGLANRQFSGAF